MKKKRWRHRSKSHAALYSVLAAVAIITLSLVFAYLERSLEPKPEPPAPPPLRLSIPVIKVDAAVQAVGIDTLGRMGLPTNSTDVAWYKFGPTPGKRGSAVMDGHIDTATSSDAVFALLPMLKPKDDIYVTDTSGKKFHFQVVKTEIYVNGYSPTEKIFDQTADTALLNLITCDGVWDPVAKNYSERMVVYSKLVR